MRLLKVLVLVLVFGVGVGFGLVGTAEANCDLKASVKVKNYLDQTLTLKDYPLAWGKWDTEPPKTIPPNGAITFQASGVCGTASGTEGTVKYQIGDDSTNWITIGFDVPWGIGATNTCNLQSSDSLKYDFYFVGNGGSSDCGGNGRILLLDTKLRLQ
ncbi:MAG: aegerolysin family protein [Pseudomonadota bacterium]